MVDEERSLRKLMRLAPKIRDHKDLETKLTSAPPHLREIIYEAVRPFLTFKARPLDRYIVSAKQMAERERLPTLDAAGNFHEFRALEVALAKEVAVNTLTLVCAKCTRKKEFYAVGNETNVDVILKARTQGWVYDYTAQPAVEICPECPTPLRKFDA
jgi:hypothetical protein